MIPYKDLESSSNIPLATLFLVLANIAVFVYQLLLPETAQTEFVYRYSVFPLEFQLGGNLPESPGFAPIFSVFTALFLHGGWLHIIGNLLYLWIFGGRIEGEMGFFRFLIFYLLCGFAATFIQIYASFHSSIPLLGASGAIAGCLAVYLRLFPKARVAVLVPIFYFFRSIVMPAWLVLGLWILLQLLQARVHDNPQSGGVAYFAHIGGFIIGFLLMPLFVKKVQKKRKKK